MVAERVRTHVSLPKKLLDEIDRLVGPRGRSDFVRIAVEEKLRREQLGRALKETAGVLKSSDYPDWDSPEKTSDWVRRSREEDDRRMREAWGDDRWQ